MNIRQATIEDLEAILDYEMKLAAQHQAYNPLRFSVFREHHKLFKEYFEKELCSDKSITNVLIINDEIVGYSLVKMDEDSLENLALGQAWLHDIYIDEKARGLGAGQMLLDASKEAAIKLGSKILMLHVATQNKFAKTLFEKNGFQETMAEMMVTL
jgi:ribosomal protein S18 acetylase RimI-like enzyme